MSTKLTGCELLAESVTHLLDHTARKTASLCGYKSKKSWLLAVEKAKKEIRKKKGNKKPSRKPIALLCPANDKVVNLKDKNENKTIVANDADLTKVTIF